jgi:hypothetical protein
MKFGKSILSPSYLKKPDFTSHEIHKKVFSFECVNCQNNVEIKFKEIIGAEWSWKSDFDKQTVSEISAFYKMNLVGKTPDGGWTAIVKIECKNCQTEYLIYAGVNEVSNSFYIITL